MNVRKDATFSPYRLTRSSPSDQAKAADAPPKRTPWFHWADCVLGGLGGAGAGGVAAAALAGPFPGSWIPAWFFYSSIGGSGAQGAVSGPLVRMAGQAGKNWYTRAPALRPHRHWREVQEWLIDARICEGETVVTTKQGAVVRSADLQELRGQPWCLTSNQIHRLARDLTREGVAQTAALSRGHSRQPQAGTVVYEVLQEAVRAP